MPCSYCLGLLVHNMFEFHTLLFLFILFFFQKTDLLYCLKLYCSDTQRWPVFETNYIAPIFHICHIYFLINNSWKLLSSIWKFRFTFLVPLKMKKNTQCSFLQSTTFIYRFSASFIVYTNYITNETDQAFKSTSEKRLKVSKTYYSLCLE